MLYLTAIDSNCTRGNGVHILIGVREKGKVSDIRKMCECFKYCWLAVFKMRPAV